MMVGLNPGPDLSSRDTSVGCCSSSMLWLGSKGCHTAQPSVSVVECIEDG